MSRIGILNVDTEIAKLYKKENTLLIDYTDS